MALDQLVQDHREDIRRIAAEHGVIQIQVFGSAARGETTFESDIDLLVEVGPHTSAWFPSGLILDLEALLGRRVDIVTERALRSELREAVLRDAQTL